MNRDYVLVTVAYNEAPRLEATVACVLRQTQLPTRWVMISDGSTDGTDAIMERCGSAYDWVTYQRQERDAVPTTSLAKVAPRKARAVEAAARLLADVPYAYFGNLDGDITFEADYYARVIAKMESDPQLGIGGGGVYNVEASGRVPGGFIKPYFVGGPVQLFRRACFEAIGGYCPYGHEDVLAVAMAQMKGWKVRCFPEIQARHHKVPGWSAPARVPVCFYCGQMDYVMGGSFWFEAIRSVARVFRRPLLVGGLALLGGFVWAWVRRERIPVPAELIRVMRAEQWRKLVVALRLGRSLERGKES
jgi:poly-beta-1,6-N-acetyl-D-glucosamine synthase